MQPGQLNKLELKLYGSLLRSALKFDRVMNIKNGNIEREIKKIAHCYPKGISRRYDSMQNAIKVSFRESGDSQFNTNKVFSAMKYVNNRLNIVLDEKWRPNHHIQYDIGQICRHKKWKFRLVLIDAFNECPCDETWVQRYGPFENGLKQPFYKTMICTKDRDPFMSIAAEENLIACDAITDGGPVQHPLIEQVFSGYDEEGGRMIVRDDYIPNYNN